MKFSLGEKIKGRKNFIPERKYERETVYGRESKEREILLKSENERERGRIRMEDNWKEDQGITNEKSKSNFEKTMRKRGKDERKKVRERTGLRQIKIIYE